MPLRNGTGPSGLGPGTGRGRGGCRSGSAYRTISHPLLRGRQGWLAGLVVPLVTVIVRDLLNPAGVLRRIVQKLPTGKITDTSRNTRQEAEYTVIDESSVPVRKKDSSK